MTEGRCLHVHHISLTRSVLRRFLNNEVKDNT